MRNVTVGRLGYYERTGGEYRDLRDIEFKLPKRRFLRFTLNGQYRKGLRYHRMHRHANPGWSVGFEVAHINWAHFKRHCWHLSVEIAKRGLTLSYGKKII